MPVSIPPKASVSGFIHFLRHIHATLLINGNFTAKVVANRLGHVNTRTTLEVYSHIFAATEEEAMQPSIWRGSAR